MSRLVAAAQQLIQQVTNTGRPIAAQAVDAPDQTGRHRVIEFDAATSAWLAPTLGAMQDERIAAMEFRGKRLHVHFVTDTRADHRDPFPIVAAKRAAGE